MVISSLNSQELVKSLKKGGVAVIPTDTVYGLVGLVSSKSAIDKIYDIKGRDLNKQLITLVSSTRDLDLLEILVDEKHKKIISKYWPGKLSIIFPRKNDTLAVRFPAYPDLVNLIKKVGPLAAPSANLQGFEPAKNIQEARSYFGNRVEYYVDAGTLSSIPSTLIRLDEDGIVVLREGAVKIEESDISNS